MVASDITFEQAQKDLKDFVNDMQQVGEFKRRLFRLMMICNDDQLANLSEGFPQHVAAFKVWIKASEVSY